MPAYYTLLAEIVPSGASSNAINLAFLASLQQGVPIRWVGPRARITRSTVTRAANVLEIDGPYAQATFDAMAQQMTVKLARALYDSTGQVWRVSVTPYDANVNGPLSWWACLGYDASQCASVTTTQDQAGNVDENPVGPGNASSSGGWFGPVLIGVGILGAILLIRRAS